MNIRQSKKPQHHNAKNNTPQKHVIKPQSHKHNKIINISSMKIKSHTGQITKQNTKQENETRKKDATNKIITMLLKQS